jgi:adenine-specific DNA methylase
MGNFKQRLGKKVKSGLRSGVKLGGYALGGYLMYKEMTEGGMTADAIDATKKGVEDLKGTAMMLQDAELKQKAQELKEKGTDVLETGVSYQGAKKGKKLGEQVYTEGKLAKEKAEIIKKIAEERQKGSKHPSVEAMAKHNRERDRKIKESQVQNEQQRKRDKERKEIEDAVSSARMSDTERRCKQRFPKEGMKRSLCNKGML